MVTTLAMALPYSAAMQHRHRLRRDGHRGENILDPHRAGAAAARGIGALP